MEEQNNLVTIDDGTPLAVPYFETFTASGYADNIPTPEFTRIKVDYFHSVPFELLVSRYFGEDEYEFEDPDDANVVHDMVMILWTTEDEREMLSDICRSSGLPIEILEVGEDAMKAFAMLE